MKGKFGIFLGVGFLVLSTIAAATGNFAVRLDLAAKQSPQGQQTAAASTSNTGSAIAIQRIALSQGAATSFGQFQARSNVIEPGTPFNIYFEPTNLATRFENGNVSASMSVDILVRNAQGQTVPSTGPAPLTQVYGDLMLNHLTFAEGRYQVVLRIHDDFNGTFADRTLDVELRRAPVTPGPRLSQSAPTSQTR
jgi:hypothetical protein